MSSRQGRARTVGGPDPIFDASRCRLRLPVALLGETMAHATGRRRAGPVATVRLEAGHVMSDGELDPQVAEMCRVMDEASLLVSIDVEAHGHRSSTTVFATPLRGVVSSALQPELLDLHPVRVARIPETLSDAILLQPPVTVGPAPITAPAPVLAEVERLTAAVGDDGTGGSNGSGPGHEVLRAAGLDDLAADTVVALLHPSCRRWHITSTWAVDEDGREGASLRGIDGAERGQWLAEGDPSGEGPVTFAPQSDGEVLRALREVLPRYWVGRSLGVVSALS